MALGIFDETDEIRNENAESYGDLLKEVQQLRIFVGFVESVVSNPIGSYSVAALDGIFARLRERIAALPK